MKKVLSIAVLFLMMSPLVYGGLGREFYLKHAVAQGDFDLAEKLLNEGVSPDIHFKDETILTQAVLMNRSDLVQLILSAGAQVDQKNDRDYTPLHLAVKNKNRAAVAILLAKRANPNNQVNGDSILHDAFKSGVGEIVDKLIEAGANPDAKDSKGMIPEDYRTKEKMK